ncbi:MAG: class I SAM-dependent methyltransferase [Sedimenticola sp.]
MAKRCEGEITRGKTARNRLRRVDNFLLAYDPNLLCRQDGEFSDALWVDLGYGAEPTTALESAERFRKKCPGLPLLGVEIDPERVERAQPHADQITHFRLGGFNLPLRQDAAGPCERVRGIRAFNVLRQYEESAVLQAYERLASQVLPGGLIFEGTSDPYGRTWVANLIRCHIDEDTPWRIESLVFSTSFKLTFDPADFQPVLPKNLIHHMQPGEPIFNFMESWKQAARETAHQKVWGMRQWFVAAAERLAEMGYPIDLQRRWVTRGWLVWRNPLL